MEADGFRFDGKLSSSISSAAAAAAKSLGLSGTSFNGYVFWGLAKPSGRDLAHRLDGLWQRYTTAATALLKADGADTSVDDFHRALGRGSIGHALRLQLLRGVQLKSLEVTPVERRE